MNNDIIKEGNGFRVGIHSSHGIYGSLQINITSAVKLSVLSLLHKPDNWTFSQWLEMLNKGKVMIIDPNKNTKIVDLG